MSEETPEVDGIEDIVEDLSESLYTMNSEKKK